MRFEDPLPGAHTVYRALGYELVLPPTGTAYFRIPRYEAGMSKRAPRTTIERRPTIPQDGSAVPTEAEAQARLAGFRSTVGRMTQAEFDAVVAVTASAEDEMTGQ